MKILKILSLFSFVVLFFMYCTKTDQVVVSTAAQNTSELLSFKTTTAPAIDGTKYTLTNANLAMIIIVLGLVAAMYIRFW